MRLDHKTAIVTGASQGMGESEALLFASEGAKVILCDVDEIKGEKVAAGIRDSGGTAEFIRCDVTNETEWEDVIEKTIKKIQSDIESFSFNTSISSFMIMVNYLKKEKCYKQKILEPLLMTVIIMTP